MHRQLAQSSRQELLSEVDDDADPRTRTCQLQECAPLTAFKVGQHTLPRRRTSALATAAVLSEPSNDQDSDSDEVSADDRAQVAAASLQAGDYECQRQERIAANEARLEALGLGNGIAATLGVSEPKRERRVRSKVAVAKKIAQIAQKPVRFSSRALLHACL